MNIDRFYHVRDASQTSRALSVNHDERAKMRELATLPRWRNATY